jgi:hypothetical protein
LAETQGFNVWVEKPEHISNWGLNKEPSEQETAQCEPQKINLHINECEEDMVFHEVMEHC